MSLQTTTISRFLQQTLMELMRAPQLQSFYLADSSALSLQYGHRYSNEIDLYTAKEFQETDLQRIKQYIHNTFGSGEQHTFGPKGNGVSFFLYNLNKDAIKVDLYYSTEPISEITTTDNVRFAGTEDLLALTLEHIRSGGNKSNYWDLHYLLSRHSLDECFAAHKQRFPDKHQKAEIKRKLVDFSGIEDEPDPRCLLKKNWNLIKLDLIDLVGN
ncbi:MAG TPA: nucleotidyl transferase AbiEii/AbiGii toxin family protein [Fluviicola sp.]|nr:nucleotidyl transferase AbiEii/AbiGii toxin family protein [Fluviicola sp.]